MTKKETTKKRMQTTISTKNYKFVEQLMNEKVLNKKLCLFGKGLIVDIALNELNKTLQNGTDLNELVLNHFNNIKEV